MVKIPSSWHPPITAQLTAICNLQIAVAIPQQVKFPFLFLRYWGRGGLRCWVGDCLWYIYIDRVGDCPISSTSRSLLFVAAKIKHV